MGIWKGIAIAAAVAGGVVALCGLMAVGLYLSDVSQAPSSAGQTIPQPPAREFTPKSFSSYAYGRTKAQIRDEFGSPDSVDLNGSRWQYSSFNPRLIVTDPDAGVRNTLDIEFYSGATLRFAGGNPPDSADQMVGDVHYY